MKTEVQTDLTEVSRDKAVYLISKAIFRDNLFLIPNFNARVIVYDLAEKIYDKMMDGRPEPARLTP